MKQIKITALVAVIYLLGSLVAAQEGEVGGESSGNRVPKSGATVTMLSKRLILLAPFDM